MSAPGRSQALTPLWRRASLSARLVVALLAVLAGYGLLVGATFRHEAAEREALALQRVSAGLAAHIVGHWPHLAGTGTDDGAARGALLQMLMTVNPGVQVYTLAGDGTVADYLGEPGMVRVPRVDLEPVRRFLAGAPLPLRGTDPMGSGKARLFSVAMLPAPREAAPPPGYLYIVLDGDARQRAGATGHAGLWRSAGAVGLLGLALAAGIGALSFRHLSQPLRALAARMQGSDAAGAALPAAGGDEVALLEHAFEQMTQRIETQAAQERAQAAAHRETMAGLAHDLRTPLTALHGLLEAMGGGQGPLLQAALSQSDKVRRLSQQLFELAALQSTQEVPQRERFRIDELVADAVGKFRLMAGDSAAPEVELAAESPGALEVDGDLQLVERALGNLIDNARRHGRGPGPVTVSLDAQGGEVLVVVQDRGPGLPAELWLRLQGGLSPREPLRRGAGGIGGLGLAIAQRVAQLHGGSLRPLPAPQGGARLCLALPRAQ